ncbi:hypothetical protein B0O99DRAFT_637969 [Bisporella sp. PMI_857]|nr:hypothetical protein B0O99DRAFT_637969 [Bisporella sp. PMI_857]
MKILCLHGRGSNNEIFQLQTASFRHELSDFLFEYVQGTVPHTEGNWSLYTSTFPGTPLYGYYDPLKPQSILTAEDDLLRLIETEGPFGGIIARDALKHPFKLAEERPFQFAIFINGVTPLKVIPIRDTEWKLQMSTQDIAQSSALIQQLSALLLRDSATRVHKNLSEYDNHDPSAIKEQLESLEIRLTMDGRLCLTDGTHAITRYSAEIDGPLIEIPTLHVRCPEEPDEHHGLHLTSLCNQDMLTEYFHHFGEDFPRGNVEIKRIARIIRKIAETT